MRLKSTPSEQHGMQQQKLQGRSAELQDFRLPALPAGDTLEAASTESAVLELAQAPSMQKKRPGRMVPPAGRLGQKKRPGQTKPAKDQKRPGRMVQPKRRRPPIVGEGKGISAPDSSLYKVRDFVRDRLVVKPDIVRLPVDLSTLHPKDREIVGKQVEIIKKRNALDRNPAEPTFAPYLHVFRDKKTGRIQRAILIRNSPNPGGLPDEVCSGTGYASVQGTELFPSKDGGYVGNLPAKTKQGENLQNYRLRRLGGCKSEGGSPFLFAGKYSFKPHKVNLGQTGPTAFIYTLGADGDLARYAAIGRGGRRPNNPPIIDLRKYNGEKPAMKIKNWSVVEVQTGVVKDKGKVTPKLTSFDMAKFAPELPKGEHFAGVRLSPDKAFQASGEYRIPFEVYTRKPAEKKGKPNPTSVTKGYFTIAAGPDSVEFQRRSNGGIKEVFTPGTRYIDGAVLRGRKIAIP